MPRDAASLAITLRVGEFAQVFGPDGTLLAAITPNDAMTGNVKLVFKAPRDIRIQRTKENPWTKR